MSMKKMLKLKPKTTHAHKKFHQIGAKKKKKKLIVERGEEYTYQKPQIRVKNCPFQFCSKDKNKKSREKLRYREIRKPDRERACIREKKENRRRKKNSAGSIYCGT
jgi:hypothetical protein